MNESRYGLLRALLITFGLISLIGIVWYSTILSAISLTCGITTCISGFALGIVDLQKKTSVFRHTILELFAIAGVLASVVKMFYDSDMFSDLWGAFPWLFPLILFATALKAIAKPNNNAINEKDIKQTQLTSH